MVAARHVVSIGLANLIGMNAMGRGNRKACGRLWKLNAEGLRQRSGRKQESLPPGLKALFLLFGFAFFDTQFVFDLDLSIKFDFLQLGLRANGVIARHLKQRTVGF